jgi:tetratricopeptide (TPR) repeat protein
MILTTDPKNLLARRDLAVALIEQKDYPHALAELQQVAAAAPDDYITRYESGIANEAMGHLREAADQFDAALRIAPNSTQAKEAVQRFRH